MGKQYSIATDQDNNDDIIQAALLVDQLMKNKTAQSALSEEKVAVVVALQLAADLQKKNTPFRILATKSFRFK